MKDPLSGCALNLLFQELKRSSRHGETFCKELVSVFQQRCELELNYSKALEKMAGRLLRVSSDMNHSSTYRVWTLISDEMFASADAHRILGNSLNQEAAQELRQILDEHAKRKRPLDAAVEKSGKLVVANWSDQVKLKKKLIGLTREHEGLFSFVEKNKQICTEKEKQKMFNRLSKSAEAQARVDEDYFNSNLEGLHMRLKLDNTLKTCYQIVQELEKQRIETLCSSLKKYSLFMAVYSQTVIHSQRQIDQAVGKVDVQKDVQSLQDHLITDAANKDSKADFLLTDYFEEEGKTVMSNDRRKDGITAKLQRLDEVITKTKRQKEGLEKMVKVYSEQPNFSSQRNLQETEQQLDEATLTLDLLEATRGKLSHSLSELQGRGKLRHRFSSSISKWKEKDCEHTVVQLSRPVRIRNGPVRSRQSTRNSGGGKRALRNVGEKRSEKERSSAAPPSDVMQSAAPSQQQEAECASLGRCKALYSFTAEREDELSINPGDVLEILRKDDTGWWFGEISGQQGHFPSTYVEELPVFTATKSSDA